MNVIEKVLKDNKIKYNFKRMNNVYIYIINDEKMVIVIKNKNDNVFSITKEAFYKIDDELLPYSFFLIDGNEQVYFYKIEEPNNSIRNAFESSKKDVIFFGKEILNKKINEKEVIELINKIK